MAVAGTMMGVGGDHGRRAAFLRPLPLVLALALVALTAWHYHGLLRDGRETSAHAERVILVANRVAILEETAATAGRSFAMTGDASFLDGLLPALEALPATAQRLEALVATDPRQAARAAAVMDLVAARARQLWHAVEARRQGGAGAVRVAAQNPQSRETERRLAETLNEITAAERAVAASRQARVDRLEFVILASLLLAGGLAGLVVVARARRRAGAIPVVAPSAVT